jgi:S1-C subfamily serine protease
LILKRTFYAQFHGNQNSSDDASLSPFSEDTLRANGLLTLALGSFILPYSFFGQSQTPFTDQINRVRPSVAQIVLIIPDAQNWKSPRMPAELQQAFKDGSFIVGTGLLINDTSDILTAAHVAYAIQDVSKKLADSNIPVNLGVSFVVSNINSPIVIRSGTLSVGAQIIGIDPEYDIAVLQTAISPEGIGSRVGGTNNTVAPKPLKFSVLNPRDGQEVFVCGFPVGSRDLVTTSGTIASAEAFEPLLTANAHGFPSPKDVYKVDLRISPGNSGGPLFRESYGAVIGIIVEVVNNGGYAVAVPAKEVTESLTKHGVKWESAVELTKLPPPPKGKKLIPKR